MSTDATATNGNFSVFPAQNGNLSLVGADHDLSKPVLICETAIRESDEVLMTEDGIVNGFESVPKLKDFGVIKSASQVSVLMLSPLMEKSFNYGLMTFPVGKNLKGEDLYWLYLQVCKIATELGITIIALLGDGDSRLRKMQLSKYIYFPPNLDWLTKIEFPMLNGLSVDRRCDFAMQDLLHTIKKMRNNINLNQLSHLVISKLFVKL